MSSIMSSPAKRKREVASVNSEPNRPLDADDGGSSPRTRVASRFGSLVIEERGAKRVRSEPEPFERSEKGENEKGENENNETDGEEQDTFKRSGNGASKDESGEGAGTQNDNTPSDDDNYTPVDPLRASLTWQDDEITVYDPNDKDDDGTGVNGIGFKPTPAIAHARALKRRQQLAEYRKREEREARARRSRRRPRVYGRARSRGRGGGSGGSGGNTGGGPGNGSDGSVSANADTDVDDRETAHEKQESTRRVRFLETGPVTIRFLEPEVAV